MIREAIVTGEVYAVLHGSVHDLAKARRFKVTSVPAAGSNVWGWFLDAAGEGTETIELSVRLIRMSWANWQKGAVLSPRHYVHKDAASLADWLRRIVKHPDASEGLRNAASEQLSTIGTA